MEKEKKTRDVLTEDGWTLVKEIANSGLEIWSKDTLRLIWRVKTESIYHLWNTKNLKT